MDRLFLRLSPATPCFGRGWGDLRAFEDVSVEDLASAPPVPVTPRWTPARPWRGMWWREGHFLSPVRSLPGSARRGRVWWAGPAGQPTRGVCLALAAWNDETPAFRLSLLEPLIRRGLTVVMLENPLYGARRVGGRQRGTPQTVEEFIQLGLGTVSEAMGLLAGFRAQGIERIGVVGFSMGGHMAALTAACLPWEVRVAAMAPSCTPASVFIDGMLSAGTRFDRLDGAHPGSGRERLRAWLDRFCVLEVPPPVSPEHALVVGTTRDGIVPPREPRRIAEHWNAELRVLDTGHVGAVTRHRTALRRAVADVFGVV
jgi:hypothetical protein